MTYMAVTIIDTVAGRMSVTPMVRSVDTLAPLLHNVEFLDDPGAGLLVACMHRWLTLRAAWLRGGTDAEEVAIQTADSALGTAPQGGGLVVIDVLRREILALQNVYFTPGVGWLSRLSDTATRQRIRELYDAGRLTQIADLDEQPVAPVWRSGQDFVESVVRDGGAGFASFQIDLSPWCTTIFPDSLQGVQTFEAAMSERITLTAADHAAWACWALAAMPAASCAC